MGSWKIDIDEYQVTRGEGKGENQKASFGLWNVRVDLCKDSLVWNIICVHAFNLSIIFSPS